MKLALIQEIKLDHDDPTLHIEGYDHIRRDQGNGTIRHRDGGVMTYILQGIQHSLSTCDNHNPLVYEKIIIDMAGRLQFFPITTTCRQIHPTTHMPINCPRMINFRSIEASSVLTLIFAQKMGYVHKSKFSRYHCQNLNGR